MSTQTDGRESVRGVDIGATPLARLTHIELTGDKTFNGVCGAESRMGPRIRGGSSNALLMEVQARAIAPIGRRFLPPPIANPESGAKQ